MTNQQEKKNQRTAFVISIGVHAAIFLLLLFIVAWRAPNPPLPEYGIVLNFGSDTQGSGDVQPETPVGTETPQESASQSNPQESVPTETKEVVTSNPAESKPAEQQVTSTVESPVSVKEVKKEETKPVEKKEKPAEKPVESKPKEEPKKEDPQAVYNPNASKTTDTKTAGAKEGKPGSEGDDKDKTGDKGDPKGDPQGAYTGKQGGGDGGTGLDLNGWNWDFIPKPNVPDNETGRIVFEIEVDENGDLIKYRKESGSVSAAAERACIAAIEKLTFTKKDGAKVPPVSKGKITFVIRAK
ncbi:MAG: hypothetical protein JNM57_08035 [Cyclobacteriaceae bacterium]|nr:hypothetical protein [Cyclobacteriaceae bacterium]